MNRQAVYAVAVPFVRLNTKSAAIFFPIHYEFLEERPKAARDAVRTLVQEEFGQDVRVRTHEVNLGYAADWHAVLAVLSFVGGTLLPTIADYLELGDRLRRLIERIRNRRGGVVHLPLLTLQTFLALSVDDAVTQRGSDRETLKVEGSLDFPHLQVLEGKQVDYAEHVFVATLSDSRRIYQYAGCSAQPYIRLVAVLQRGAARQMGWRTRLVERVMRFEPKDETG